MNFDKAIKPHERTENLLKLAEHLSGDELINVIHENLHQDYCLVNQGIDTSGKFWAQFARRQVIVLDLLKSDELRDLVGRYCSEGWEVCQVFTLPDGIHYTLIVSRYV